MFFFKFIFKSLRSVVKLDEKEMISKRLNTNCHVSVYSLFIISVSSIFVFIGTQFTVYVLAVFVKLEMICRDREAF